MEYIRVSILLPKEVQSKLYEIMSKNPEISGLPETFDEFIEFVESQGYSMEIGTYATTIFHNNDQYDYFINELTYNEIGIDELGLTQTGKVSLLFGYNSEDETGASKARYEQAKVLLYCYLKNSGMWDELKPVIVNN